MIVIDGELVITGPFNFSKSAQEKNAENVLLIRDPALSAKYVKNWEAHRQHSQPYVGRGVRPRWKAMRSNAGNGGEMTDRPRQERIRRGWKTIAWIIGVVFVLLLLLAATENIQASQILSITQETYWLWDLVLKALLLCGAVGTVVGAINQMKKNRDERERATTQQREELTWRRTQFLLQLWKDFNADISFRPCIKQVDAGDEDPHLASLFRTNPTQLPDDQADLRYHFDRYFDFLMSLAHCEKEGILSLTELSYFGWHYERILASTTLTSYCRHEGFDEVVILAEKMKSREGWV